MSPGRSRRSVRAAFCPACAQQRVGDLRYCMGCGFDFDSVDATTLEQTTQITSAVSLTPADPVLRRRPTRNIGIAFVGLLGIGATAMLMSPAGDVGTTPPPVTEQPSNAAAVPPASPSPAPTQEPSQSPAPTLGPTGPTTIGTVTRVIDGDTIRVSVDGVEYPVRYIGIDSPEPDATDAAARAMADQATSANAALVDGREIILERDVSETDRYDRLLRNVWVDDGMGGLVFVNAELIRRGYAQVTTYPPDVKYVDLLTAAQQSARTAALGLWAPATTPSTPTPAPAPTAAPTPTPVVAVNDGDFEIGANSRRKFRGAQGDYTWTSLVFWEDRMTVRWNATADAKTACRVAWQLRPDDDDVIKSTIRVKAGDIITGNRRYGTPFLDAALKVDSTCPSWWISLQGYEATSSSGGGSSCDPSYPGVCIPPYPPDLDCGEISYRNFTVRGSDPHGFDGDNDGIGCES